jgi:DNA-binding transcriptional MerR regulator
MEARRHAALERQGFSAEEIEEMLEDPDADEDWAIVGMELDE